MITNSTVSFQQAQAGCFHLGGTLSFLTSEADFYKVTAKDTSSGSNSEMFLIGNNYYLYYLLCVQCSFDS